MVYIKELDRINKKISKPMSIDKVERFIPTNKKFFSPVLV